MPINHKALLRVALTATLIACSAQALGGPGARPYTLDPTVTVHFADLNLNSPEGARVLYGRIQSAAQRVCGPDSSLWDPGRRTWTECCRATVAWTVERINRPTLTALHLRIAKTEPG